MWECSKSHAWRKVQIPENALFIGIAHDLMAVDQQIALVFETPFDRCYFLPALLPSLTLCTGRGDVVPLMASIC